VAPLDLQTALSSGLADLDADAPAGPSLEFDADFGALERAAQGTPERQAGNSIIPAEDPNWKEVAQLAADLLERTHDLRVMVHLAVARLHLSSQRASAPPSAALADFGAVLGLIRERLTNRWEHVHPQLDPEDDNDPTFRANALLQLAHPTRVLRVLRTMTLAASGRAGAVSWRVIGVATGAIETDEESEKKTEAEIRAAFDAIGAGQAAALRETVDTALRELKGIGAAFDSHCGYGYGPNFDDLTKLLAEIGRYVETYGARETETSGVESAGDEMDAGDTDSPGVPAARGGAARAASGISAAALTAVTTRADAVRLLDLVCRYYEQYEPSSPLPLLIARARNLADKGFLEILQDLAPDGLSQAQAIVKSRDE
jgi:type VI secretion system protein ImpA